MTPLGTKGIVLIEEVVFTFMPYQSIGVIHPVFFWGEVKLWPIKINVILMHFPCISVSYFVATVLDSLCA